MDHDVDWGLYAMVKGICPAIDASLSSFAAAIPTAATPTIPTNNGQMSDEITDWNLATMVNDFFPTTIDFPSSSLSAIIPITTTTTFIPTITTTPSILENKSHVFDGINGWNLGVMLNGLYPTIDASSSFFDIVNTTTTTTTTPLPTITTASIVHLNNSQIFDESIDWNLHARANSFYPTIATSSPSITTPYVPMDINNPQSSRFHGESSNQLQSMNENNIMKELMQISNNSLNFSNKNKRPLSCNNWPIFSLPGYGKIPGLPNHQHNQFQGAQPSVHIFAGTSKSKKR
ncbi:hypothetical protein LXL04_022613 [Taraxacum kok-saghyz]